MRPALNLHPDLQKIKNLSKMNFYLIVVRKLHFELGEKGKPYYRGTGAVRDGWGESDLNIPAIYLHLLQRDHFELL